MTCLNRVLVAIMLTMAIQTPARAMETIKQDELWEVLKPYYPIYNKNFDCHGVIAGTSNKDDPSGDLGFCVDIDRQIIVNTDQYKRLYVLVTGDLEFDGYGEPRMKGHVFSGLAGMFVLKPSVDRDDNDIVIGMGWQIESASAEVDAGASGYGLRDWKLTQVAPELYAFVNQHSDIHQGYVHSGLVLLAPDKRNITQSFIANGFSSMATGRCGEADQPVCDDIEAKLHRIDKSQTVNGYYPIQMKVNGVLNGKTYQDKIYTFYYEPDEGYQAQKGYPLHMD